MTDRLQAVDRIQMAHRWAEAHEDADVLMQRARRLRAIETSKLFGRMFNWFGGGSHALDSARVADELSKLDDRELADIGLRRDDIARIAAGGDPGHRKAA